MNIINTLENSQNCLLISNACGGGHVQVADKINSLIDKKNQNTGVDEKITTITKDIFIDILGKFLGNYLINDWNNNQKQENIAKLNRSVKYQGLADLAMSLPTFLKTLFWIWKNDIDTVINLQPIANKPLLKAIQMANFINNTFRLGKKTIKLSLIMTELPGPRTQTFFNATKSINKIDRKFFTLITTKQPLLDYEGQSEEEFWKIHSGLSLKKGEVRYDEAPIRPSFIEQEAKSEKIHQLQIKASEEELTLIKKSTGNHTLTLESTENGSILNFNLQKEEKVFALMLGSQTSVQSTLDYIKHMISWSKQTNGSEPYRLFVFCGKHLPNSNSLMKQITELAEKERLSSDYPNHLTIVPLAIQSDKQIAPIIARANATITRSGGITSMELKAVAQGKIFIHIVEEKEDKEKGLPLEQIIEEGRGMPYWEGGNYRYLKSEKGAELITPQKVESLFNQAFLVNNQATSAA